MGSPHERVVVLDVDVTGSRPVTGLDECDGELAVRGLARDEQVFTAAERDADLDDCICIPREIFRRQ